MKTVTYDIETTPILYNGDVKDVHCIAIKEGNNETKMFTSYYNSLSSGSLTKAKEILSEADLCIGYNNQGFDRPVLEKFWDIRLPKQLDLMIVAQLMYSQGELFSIDNGIEDMPNSIKGGFSLKAWGYRFGEDHKLDYDDWSKLSSDMIIYGIRDVELTHRLYQYLIKQENYPLQGVIDLEHDLKAYIALQTQYGWYFDKDKADELNRSMLFRKFTLEKKLQKVFTPKYLADGKIKRVKKPFKRSIWKEK